MGRHSDEETSVMAAKQQPHHILRITRDVGDAIWAGCFDDGEHVSDSSAHQILQPSDCRVLGAADAIAGAYRRRKSLDAEPRRLTGAAPRDQF